jgi:hypothetical protein
MKLLTAVYLASLLLVACGREEETAVQTTRPADERREEVAPHGTPITNPNTREVTQDTALVESSEQHPWPEGEVRLDEQGSVEVSVAPMNLNSFTDLLQFEVSLNTHSVELSMDLATLATLEADNGMRVQASLWDAPRGGHHVSGRLAFPAEVDGAGLLDDARRLTLRIRDVDARERQFVWEAIN